ncbi:hypothetical protein CLTEP_05350 [Clostridium tepidiprofundi DSM 19306]|uniref:Uncharacterized protein n=1 Tax=Clostridium tepidiprofundi DSM 19306 TaxID=1121338 RepID=A0A151B6M1_9CLOT|nr:hypothetical protein [Clostridium tepidiprofundi]KYH35591.1 hypothetical protein CLTEP_05350 [Clostridium tepidiprofundi DSM 19306]
MKKIISLFITMFMLSCFIFPLCVTAQENSIDIKHKLQKLNAQSNSSYSLRAWGIINVLDALTACVIPYETEEMVGSIRCLG